MLTGKEIDEYIKSKYQNNDNALILPSFIDVLHHHEESDDQRIKSIVKNFKNIQALLPTLSIHQTFDETYFTPSLGILNIKFKEKDILIAHELGHIVADSSNIFGKEISNNIKTVFIKAKNNCKSEKNKDKFKSQIEILTDEKNLELEPEKQVISDILSAIFQDTVIKIEDKEYRLKYGHKKEYFSNKGKAKWNRIVGETFANYYTLVLYNKAEELELLKEFLGEDWVNFMSKSLSRASKIIETPNIYKEPTLGQVLGKELINCRIGNLPQKLPKIEETDKKQSKEAKEIEER